MQAFLDRYLFFLEFVLFAGIVLAFAIWQYVEVSPKKDRTADGEPTGDRDDDRAGKGDAST